MHHTAHWTATVCRVGCIAPSLLMSGNRSARVVLIRQAIMFVMVRKQRTGLTGAGRLLGRHHATVLHGIRVFETLLRGKDPAAIRAYKIAVRSYVAFDRAEQQVTLTLTGPLSGFEQLQNHLSASNVPHYAVSNLMIALRDLTKACAGRCGTRDPGDRSMKQLPKKIEVDGQTWTLMKPGMYLRDHVGEVTAPGGVVFEISSSLNRLSTYIETPYDYPGAENGMIGDEYVGKAMYQLSTTPQKAVKELFDLMAPK